MPSAIPLRRRQTQQSLTMFAQTHSFWIEIDREFAMVVLGVLAVAVFVWLAVRYRKKS